MALFRKTRHPEVARLQRKGLHVFNTAIREFEEQEIPTEAEVTLVSIGSIIPEWRELPFDKAMLRAIKEGAGYVPADIAFKARRYPQKIFGSNTVYLPFRQSGSEGENSFYVFALEKFPDNTLGIDTMLLWPNFNLNDAKVMLLAPTKHPTQTE